MSWDRDKLLMELSSYHAANSEQTSPELQRYLSFYKFGFVNELHVQHRVGWIEAGAYRIVLQTFEQAQSLGTVFVFHGYFDHAGIYHHLIEHLLRRGFSVALYDMPGHGLSSGKPTDIENFAQYQEVMDAALRCCDDLMPKPFHAVGQSTGGAVLVDRLSQVAFGDSFDKVVLLAPLVRPKGWANVKLMHSALDPFFKVWRRSFSINSSDKAFIQFLQKIDPLQSRHLSVRWIAALKRWVQDIESRQSGNKGMLIIQGDADQTVEWRHNIEVIKRLFGQVSICLIEGGKHHLVNESATTRAKMFAAIDRELGVA